MLQVNINGEYYNTMKLINGEWIIPITHIKKKRRKKFYIITYRFMSDIMSKYSKNDKTKFNRIYSTNFKFKSLIKTNKEYKYVFLIQYYSVKRIKLIKSHRSAYKK